MIALALLVAGILVCLSAAHALDENPRTESKAGALDGLLFALCLAGILLQRKRERDESDE